MENKMKSVVQNILCCFLIFWSCVVFADDFYLENLNTTDTYLRSSVPNQSFGFDQNLITGGWGDMYITLIKFNISTLPSRVDGDKVSLWLYNKNSGGTAQPTAVNMGLLASDFNKSTTWNMGVRYYNFFPVYKQVNVNGYGYWTEFDITDYYSYWKKGWFANYGLLMIPTNINNYFNLFQSASVNTPSGQKPFVRIIKASSKIMLKWPLSTPYHSRKINHGFRKDWAGGSDCPPGVIKKHNGTDYQASPGDSVFAAESGYVKIIIDGGDWANAIVIEHSKPDNAKFTIVYWHVVPSIKEGRLVNKGDKIAVVANIPSGPHLHFGIRDAAYDTYTNPNGTISVFSGTGALPQQNCVDQEKQKFYPAFPEKFWDIEDNPKFSFQ